jgi:hypothetical protein
MAPRPSQTSREHVGSDYIGWLHFQTLYDQLAKTQPRNGGCSLSIPPRSEDDRGCSGQTDFLADPGNKPSHLASFCVRGRIHEVMRMDLHAFSVRKDGNE